MPELRVDGDRVRFGERLAVSFHRTLRVPDDGRAYPLPAGLGRFPIVPMSVEGGAAQAVPMHPREAMWIGLSGAVWKPNAVKVLVGGINAVSGSPDDGGPPGMPQDYLVCPPQPWLDGFNAGDGAIRQFVAMELGAGYAVEAGHGLPERGGITILAFEPVPGRFPDAPPPPGRGPVRLDLPRPPEVHEMAFGAGGRVRQKLYPDPHGGPATWDAASAMRFTLRLVNARELAAHLGAPPFPTPIDASTYAAAGLPWFELDDGASGHVRPAAGGPPRTIREVDVEREDSH
ncbi:MAG TPA: hypothetical protein VFY87_12360 [Geminicoccaceae bacterium]|nr:hypothetical protein [Geminicoccaceae bacterium]